jgi:hypothetical protein
MWTVFLRRALLLACLVAATGVPAAAGTEELASRPVDEELLRDFQVDYNNAQGDYRAVFQRYLEPLGAAAMLRALEDGFPRCHTQAHELGAAVYESIGDLGLAVEICGDGCTAGCMHGAVREALGSRPLGEVRRTLRYFCATDAMAELFPKGNCAHALGLAAMAAAGGDLQQALRVCSGHAEPAMEYYCATGVYSEYFGEATQLDLRVVLELHFPCSETTSFPVACYRYKGPLMHRALKGDAEAQQDACLTLSGAARRGCFHGLGVARLPEVFENPSLLAVACAEGNKNDRILCIEGVVEKLADYDDDRALEACASLSGRMGKACLRAAEEKMYRLDKKSLPLYMEP